MSLSVKNSLSLSLSVSYIRTFLCCVSSRRARSPSQRVSNVPILFSVFAFLRSTSSRLPLFSYSHPSFVFAKFLSFGSKSTALRTLGFAKGKSDLALRVVVDSTRVRSILSVVSLTYRIHVYLSSIACRRSLLLIRLLKFLNVIVYFTSLRNGPSILVRSSFVCVPVFISHPLLFTLYLCLCPMTSRFRPFHSCSSEPKRNACRCFTANTDLHVHLAQYNTVSFSPLCKSWC